MEGRTYDQCHWSDDKRAGGENSERNGKSVRKSIVKTREGAGRETCGKQVRGVKTNKHKSEKVMRKAEGRKSCG
jgi:hypothetical protein